MKRSDLPTERVLRVYNERTIGAWEYFIHEAHIPPKVLLAALERDVRNGYLNYGVSIRRSWLTPKGRIYLLIGQQ